MNHPNNTPPPPPESSLASPEAPPKSSPQALASPASVPCERPGRVVKGPWVVAATLSLFVIVPAVVTGIFFMLESTKASGTQLTDAPLVWSERADWPRTFFTTFKSLERGPMSAARTNKKYKDLGFHVSPTQQLAVNRCEALAKQPPAVFRGEATREALQSLLDEQPELFYAHHLLAAWHRLRGQSQEAKRHQALAFEHAPAALIRRYVDADGKPLADVVVPPLAIVADQLVDDRVDGSLVLVYPHLLTDADGFVAMPIYKAVLRETAPGLPAGVLVIPDKPQWFTFFGRVGRRPDATID